MNAMGAATESKKEIDRILNGYVKNVSTGNIYQALLNPKNDKKIMLRNGNKYDSRYAIEIKQGLVNGVYSRINEHELKKWAKKDNDFMESLSRKLLKRIVLAQLLLETDEDLLTYKENDDRLSKLIKRSNKECERVACKHYDELYNVGKEMLQGFMNKIDSLTTNIGKMDIHDFAYVDNMVTKYKANPENYKEFEVLEFEVIK